MQQCSGVLHERGWMVSWAEDTFELAPGSEAGRLGLGQGTGSDKQRALTSTTQLQ